MLKKALRVGDIHLSICLFSGMKQTTTISKFCFKVSESSAFLKLPHNTLPSQFYPLESPTVSSPPCLRVRSLPPSSTVGMIYSQPRTWDGRQTLHCTDLNQFLKDGSPGTKVSCFGNIFHCLLTSDWHFVTGIESPFYYVDFLVLWFF